MSEHTDKPQVELEPGQVICPRHGEPFRFAWPAGYPTFAVQALSAVANDEAFILELGGDPADLAAGNALEPIDPVRIRHVLEARPLCCRMDGNALEQLYVEVAEGTDLFGARAACVNCRRRSLGTPYVTTVGGRTRQHSHVCFRCVVHNLAPWGLG